MARWDSETATSTRGVGVGGEKRQATAGCRVAESQKAAWIQANCAGGQKKEATAVLRDGTNEARADDTLPGIDRFDNRVYEDVEWAGGKNDGAGIRDAARRRNVPAATFLTCRDNSANNHLLGRENILEHCGDMKTNSFR